MDHPCSEYSFLLPDALNSKVVRLSLPLASGDNLSTDLLKSILLGLNQSEEEGPVYLGPESPI